MIRFCLAIIFLFFLSCCQNQNSKEESSPIPFKVIPEDIKKYGRNMFTVKRGDEFDTLIKFNSLLNDTQFYVKPQKIKLKSKLDFSNYEDGKLYITRTTNEVKEKGFNFAGHYSFVFWGCGSACKLAAVIDLNTGKVYNGVPSSIGYSFKKDSRILIINPPDTADFYYKYRFCGPPEQYVWTEKGFEKIGEDK